MGKNLINLLEEMEQSIQTLISIKYIGSFEENPTFSIRWKEKKDANDNVRHVGAITAFLKVDSYTIPPTFINDVFKKFGEEIRKYEPPPPNTIYFVLEDIFIQIKNGRDRHTVPTFSYLPTSVHNLISNEEISFDSAINDYSFDYILPEHLFDFHNEYGFSNDNETEKIKLLVDILLDEKILPDGTEFDFSKKDIYISSFPSFDKIKRGIKILEPDFYYTISVHLYYNDSETIIDDETQEKLKNHIDTFVRNESHHEIHTTIHVTKR